MPTAKTSHHDSRGQRWLWWPLLPLYPYQRRRTLIRELVPGRIWCFEQLHGVWYVAVPIRMTVVKVDGGLLLYAPVPPTREVVDHLQRLEQQHGPVLSIVLPTASGLEHKIPVPAMARAFPAASVWITEKQWSFPLQLPQSWLGFPASRTRVLMRDGLPHAEQLSWIPLGPIDLGLGPFLELACLDQATGSLLVTDALVVIPQEPPALYQLDPTPLLFHARDCGADSLVDTQEQRQRGWKRIVLFANFFRPMAVEVPGFSVLLGDILAAKERSPANHFGFFPFRWASDWELAADALIASGQQVGGCSLAPVLERLVFARSRDRYVAWLRRLANAGTITRLIPAHYEAPLLLASSQLATLAESIEQGPWAPSHDSWQLLASIDHALVAAGIVPADCGG
ncbi:MAG: DUF4336 domain-containing protein [Cyanobium sp.]